jgi:hypothetical protein
MRIGLIAVALAAGVVVFLPVFVSSTISAVEVVYDAYGHLYGSSASQNINILIYKFIWNMASSHHRLIILEIRTVTIPTFSDSFL